MSDRQIAEHVGVDHVTVAKYRRVIDESTGENHQLPSPRTGKDGKKRKLPDSVPPKCAEQTKGDTCDKLAEQFGVSPHRRNERLVHPSLQVGAAIEA